MWRTKSDTVWSAWPPAVWCPPGSGSASIEARDHGDTFDFAIEVSLQESVVIFKRHAAVRIAVRPEHVSVSQQAAAAKGFAFVLRNHPQRAHAVERGFAHF